MNNVNIEVSTEKDITIERKIEKYIQFFEGNSGSNVLLSTHLSTNTNSNSVKGCSRATCTDLHKLQYYLRELNISTNTPTDLCCSWITR